MKTPKMRNKRHLQQTIAKIIEKEGHNADLNDLDVSNVTDISGMFYDSPSARQRTLVVPETLARKFCAEGLVFGSPFASGPGNLPGPGPFFGEMFQAVEKF